MELLKSSLHHFFTSSAENRQVDVATYVTWLLAAQRQVYVMPALDRQNIDFPRALDEH